MTDALSIGTVIALCSLVTGCYIFLSRHAGNTKKHQEINKDKIVYKDFCEQVQTRLEQKMDMYAAQSVEHHTSLKSDMAELNILVRKVNNL